MWRAIGDIEQNNKSEQERHSGWFRDSGLLCHILRVCSVDDLRLHKRFATIWRSFVCEELLKGFADCMVPVQAVSCWGRKLGADLLLRLPARHIAIAIPPPYAAGLWERDGAKLEHFSQTYGCDYGILLGFGRRRARRLSTRVFEVPVGCL